MMCSYFMGDISVDREYQGDMKAITRVSVQDFVHAFLPQGGELVSQKLADILKHPASKESI
jgi:hypothetical protein